jgi:hypothetical protein
MVLGFSGTRACRRAERSSCEPRASSNLAEMMLNGCPRELVDGVRTAS